MNRLQLAALLVIVASCGRSSFSHSSAPPPGDPPVIASPPQVGPAAQQASDTWNTYVSYSGGSLLAIDGSPCSSTPTYHDCVHAGELRRLDLTELTSCTGVTTRDSLSAFAWSCFETAAGVSLVSTGLMPGVGLRDLIDFGAVAFRPMHVTVIAPDGQRATNDSVWWSNPVVIAPADNGTSGATLNGDSTIYLVPQSRNTAGLNLSGRGAALVTAPGVRLSAANGVAQCSQLNSGVNTRQPAQCVIWANNSERLWLEVEVWTDPALGALELGVDTVVLPRLHNIHLHPQFGALQLLNVQGGRITSLTADYNGALPFQGVHDTLVRDMRSAGGEVYLFDSHDNVFENVTAFGTYAGVDMQGSDTNNVFVRLLSFAHSGFGLQMVGAGNAGNQFVGYTFADVSNAPLGLFNGERQTFALGVVANGAQHGADITDVSQTFTNLVSSGSGYQGIELDNGAGNERFSGQLRIGQIGTGTCEAQPAVLQPGLATGTCAATDLSVLSYVQTELAPLGPSFYGAVTSDTVNLSDTAGTASMPADPLAFDYSGAENRYRGWIGGTMLGPSDRICPATCFTQTGAVMQLADWRLAARDTLLRNTSLLAAGNPPFVDGAACPAGLDGNTVAQDTHGGEVAGDGVGNDNGLCEDGEVCAGNTYVIAAIEIIDDYLGDDDGLCESSEACIYAPNYGAYQGEGDYRTHTCVFADGTVRGVTMYAYPTNGATPPP